ncbi:MAG: small metal-binding protein SmbP [Candidatus Manganitrophaceae bacterium]
MKRTILTMAAVASILSISPLKASAADPGCEEMKKQAQEAVSHGKAGHVDTLVKHATAMLSAGKLCKTGGEPAKQAMAEGQSAVDHGKAGHLDVALKHAQEAAKHANEIK